MCYSVVSRAPSLWRSFVLTRLLVFQVTQLKAEASLERAQEQEEDRKTKRRLEKSLAEASAAKDEATNLKVCLRT